MRYLIFLMTVTFSTCFSEPRHLWQEEGKILWYKSITLENSICIIDSQLDELNESIENEDDILNIKKRLIILKSLTRNCKHVLGLSVY